MARMSVEDRRALLIESAHRVIASHGVEGATTRRICSEAGMPLASFHYAFPSRIDLLQAVMQDAVPRDVYELAASLAPEDLGTGGYQAMNTNMRCQLDAFAMVMKADPGRVQAAISLGIYAHNHPELDAAGKGMYAQLHEVTAAGLQTAADKAGVQWRTPVNEIAPIVFAGAVSVALIYLTTGDETIADKVFVPLLREVMTYVVDDRESGPDESR